MLLHIYFCDGCFIQMLKDSKNLLKMSLKILFIKRKKEIPFHSLLSPFRPAGHSFPAVLAWPASPSSPAARSPSPFPPSSRSILGRPSITPNRCRAQQRQSTDGSPSHPREHYPIAAASCTRDKARGPSSIPIAIKSEECPSVTAMRQRSF